MSNEKPSTGFTQSFRLSPQSFDLIYLILLALYILAGTSLVPFHGDEATQIYMSRDYAYQFIQRDLSQIRYSDPPISAQEQFLRLINGTVNKYLIGLAWHIGGFTMDDINEQWDWGADWTYNQTTGHAPSPELLIVSRIPSALFAAGGAVLIFALGFMFGGRPAAYLASLFYAINPLILINGRRAMMEGSFIFFALLLVLAGIWFCRAVEIHPPQERRRRIDLSIFPFALGLALASKHTAVFSIAAVCAACAGYIVIDFIKHRHDASRFYIRALRIFFSLLYLTVCGLLIFLVLNPAWWDDPFARLSDILRLRQDLLTGQTAAFGGYSSFTDTLGGFWRQVFVGLPQYYEVPVWQTYTGDQIASYEASVWRGIAIGGSTIGGMVLLTCVLTGVGTLFRRRAPLSARWMIGVWALAVTVTTLFLTPLEWGRYYLLMIPVIGLFGAAGAAALIRYGLRRGKSWTRPDSP